MKKKLLSLCVLTIMLVMGSCSNDEFDDVPQQEKESGKVFSDEKAVQDASFVYEKLMQSFTVSPLKSSSDGEITYPEYYGGSYIDEKGQLIVYIAQNKTKSASVSNPIIKSATSNNIVVKEAQYSYNELNGLMESINKYKLEQGNNNITDNFLSYYLSDTDNRIVIELQEFNEKRVQEFKLNVNNSPAITFTKANGKPQDIAMNVNPGAFVSYTVSISPAQWKEGSVGYRAKIGTKVGVVTAAHVIMGLNNELESGNIEFAKATKWAYSGNVDAAFCEVFDNTFVPTNTLNGTSNLLSTSLAEPGVGTLVNKIGAKTGPSSGYINNTNASLTVDGVTITNLTSVKTNAARGDSGGIVYSYVSASNTRFTLGILKGINNSGYAYYCKARLVNATLGCTRY